MEELDIPGALERLKPYSLSSIERVLTGHAGTVQWLLSLLFDEPVDVVLIRQHELDGQIHREVSLKLRYREIEMCRAVSVIDLDLNAPLVLHHIREGRLGLGQIAVMYNVPIKRTINTIEVNQELITRQYTMEGDDPGHQILHYVITESFPRMLYN